MNHERSIPLLSGWHRLVGCLLAAILFTGLSGTAWSSDISVVKGGQTVRRIPSLEEDGTVFVAVQDLADILQAQIYWSHEKKKIDLTFAGHVMTLTAFNPVVIIDQRALNLPHETIYRKGTMWVPIEPLTRALQQMTPGYVSWNSEQSQLRVGVADINITSFSIDSKRNGTLVSISTLDTFSLHHALDASNWLTLTLLQGRLDPLAFTLPTGRGFIDNVKAYQFEESCQISFHLAGDITDYQVFQKTNPDRIVILLRHGETGLPSSTADDSSEDLKPDPDLAVFDLIVLDAGHGGKDPGAIGPTGLQEKGVVLDVAKRLADLLREHLKVNVILTRDDDTYVPLQRRTEIANSTGADLFISIHANAARRRSAHGCETYFLSPAKNDDARAVAMLENAALKLDEESGLASSSLNEEDFILRDIVGDMLQSSFLKESEDLAGLVQEKMEKRLNLANRGVDQAGFYVLVGAKMPSVLIEIAFISNTSEKRLLQQRSFHQTIAEAIFEGIKQFKTRHESNK